jgi:2-(1,2-epoxy-1,2-dihydrophenyl)acetyl-CoA isomerase
MLDSLKYHLLDRIAVLTLNRPQAKNALSPELTAHLINQLRKADQDPQVKCILIQAEGSDFSAGGDVKGFNELLALPAGERYDTFERKLLLGNRLPSTLLEVSKPIIAAPRGAVAGAGLALCLAADFVVASDTSYFIAAHVLVGLSLDCGLSSLLVASMGIKRAKRIALLGERLSAQEALEHGIVTKIVPDAQLEVEVEKLAQRLAQGPSTAMAATKALLNKAAHQGFVDQLANEATYVARCAADEDFGEGIQSALQRKPPAFR